MASTQTLGAWFRAPPLRLLATEPLRGLLDLAASTLSRRARPVGDGHSVLVFPGLGAAGFTTSCLRRHLTHAGFKSHDWGLGMNTGPKGAFDPWLSGLVDKVQQLHAASGRKISLVGWSLGGIYAREIAKLCPGSVRQVITLGTPIASVGDAHHVRLLYLLLNGDTSQLTPALQARLRERPPVPTTALYSKKDGVVSWHGCVEKSTKLSESVEVKASHLGMVTHPQVLRLVADRLTLPEDDWRPLCLSRRTS